MTSSERDNEEPYLTHLHIEHVLIRPSPIWHNASWPLLNYSRSFTDFVAMSDFKNFITYT